MKIIKISFENINNLKGGPHVISFHEAPLASAGIFAITGPTGSGKSTILDVITLALFNRIPRFSKAISKKEMSDLGSIMTHHTNSASASIEYEVRGQRYTSFWSVSKTRTGKIKDYEMALMNATGSYLDLKRSEVPGENEKIIGLKYDQFIKSIILAQGEFSKFLKADKNEQGELLENITGATIYRTLGQAAYQKHKNLKESLDHKKSRLEEYQALTDDERKEIYDAIEYAKSQKTTLDHNIIKLLEVKQLKTDIKQLDDSIRTKTQESLDIKKRLDSFKPKLTKLKLHEKLSPLQGDIRLYEHALSHQEAATKELNGYHVALQEAEVKINTILAEMSALTGQVINSSNFKQYLMAFEKEVNQMDADRANLQIKGDEQRQRINEQIKKSPLSLNTKIKPAKALELLRTQHTNLAATINQSTLDHRSDVNENRKQLKSDHQTLIFFKEVHHHIQHITEISDKLNIEKNKLSEVKDSLQTQQPLFDKSNALVTFLQEKEKLLQKQKEDGLKIANLEKLRPGLISGEPCPLCGSLEHPYTTHQPDSDQSAIEKEIIANQRQLKHESDALKTITVNITKNTTTIKLIEERIPLLEKNYADVIAKKEALKTSHLSVRELNEETLTTTIDTLSDKIAIFEKAIDALDLLKVNEELTKEYQTFEQILKDYQRLDQQRKQKFTGKDATSACNTLQDNYQTYQTQKSEITKAIELQTNNLQKAQRALTEIEIKLTPQLAALGFGTIKEMSLQLLTESEYQNIKKENEQLTTSQTTTNTELNTLINNKENKSKLDNQPSTLLEEVQKDIQHHEKMRDTISTSIGEKTAKIKHDDEVRVTIKTKKDEITKLTKASEIWSNLNQMIGDSTGNKFANFAQGLTLQHLLVLANKRLSHLSDRYLLDKPDESGVLNVVDMYQGNTTRSVTTLSGGETFLISLALALSLSDMASNNVPLDSLFIDEGFGTLDQETLDMAMDTLERLQSESQKTVGVISHVEALKERINVQIKLIKNAQGYSHVEVG